VSNTSKGILAVVALVLVACCCISVICVGGAAALIYGQWTTDSTDVPFSMPTLGFEPVPTLPIWAPTFAPQLETPNPQKKATATPFGPTATPFVGGGQASQAAMDTLKTLENSIVPEHDPVKIAQAYKGKGEIPATVPAPDKPYKVGDKKKFWLSNTDTQKYRQVTATLRYQTPHLYFWVDEAAASKANLNSIKKICDTFESSIYPTNRKFFGSEWSPGIDNEIPLYVLYATNIGSGVAGFFSSVDEVPPDANQYSNAHEMFVVSADASPLNRSYDYGTFAHEFQHMIHFHTDRNEESWVNEGFSELAQLLNKYDTGSSDQVFLADPDLQLNTWEPDIEQNRPHYGASYLFFSYFLGRFGEEATKAVVANTDNGWDSIDAVFKELNIKDPDTGAVFTSDDVFADWVIANIVPDKSVAGGLYDYPLDPKAPKAGPGETIERCPADVQDGTVHQYGTDYIEIACPGTVTLDFQGAIEAQLLPENPKSGGYAFWSNRGDESDMTLTHDFDLSAVSGPVSLKYSTWYDIEGDYDYVFLSASEDGKTWKTLKTSTGTNKNPGGANLGIGYTGKSNGWQDEDVDLSAYAGKKVQLRFEYLTDAAVNQNGLLLDDISIPALNYQSDFEKDDGGWKADGFVRVSNQLPQTFRVSLIRISSKITVEHLTLDAAQHGTTTITLAPGETVVIAISGTTRFTTQQANYRFTVK
jgi:immune inhibitor A